MRDVFLDAELSNVKWNALSASESNNVFSSAYNKFNKLVNKHAPIDENNRSIPEQVKDGKDYSYL